MATLQRIFQAGRSEVPLLRAGMRGMCTKGPKSSGKGKTEKPATPTPPPPPRAAPPPQPPRAAAPPPPPPRAAAPPPPPAAPAFVYTSAATPAPPTQSVGPGANKGGSYPNTEYYCYNDLSFFDLEVEMAEHRVKQPSADNGHF